MVQLGFHCTIEKSDNRLLICKKDTNLSDNHPARVVRKLDNVIHWINHYSVDSVVCLFAGYWAIYPLDSVIQL